MVPLGMLCIKASKRILRVPRNVLMPLILLFCIVGTFAINNTAFEVGVMLVAGLVAYVLEANAFPIAPAILGVVLGGMLEENFITSMIKSNGDFGAFFERPIALGLAVLTMVVWFAPLLLRGLRSMRSRPLPT
jgi:putative tricarboxylic transport membrane protein